MLSELRPLFDHARHKLEIRDLASNLDVLSFEGEEALSQPFRYRIQFTSRELAIPAEQVLLKEASFSLCPPSAPMPFMGLPIPPTKPLRTLYGVITSLCRLAGSRDEARYEVTLQPRLALLGLGRQSRIFQQQSVPEIVETVLREHGLAGQDFLFQTLKREYPKREQVMQFGESDLSFLTRLLADVGIWFTFRSDERLKLEKIEFNDDQRGYRGDINLPLRHQSGTQSTGQDSVWNLRSRHRVVEQHVNIRAYHYPDAAAFLDGDVDQTQGAKGLYGEAYHYAEPYRDLGDPYQQDEDLLSESGYFFARLRHERYLNRCTRLSGDTSSATLAPGDQLVISDGAPSAFSLGAVITHLSVSAARDQSFKASFLAIPYAENICFRPPLQFKPRVAGTLPARVTSPENNPTYAEIDLSGRYRVNFLFDRTHWKRGQESMWLRLARPYAGETYGLHMPLLAGTEVGIAFEQGDIDRPYIAHCFHDSLHPDHVTLKNHQRNVLRTPANNKLRLEDRRGEEHIKLSTEHSGKSQLNLGHLVDAQRRKRGEGFELRTDGWGAVRAGKGLLLSADEQPGAQGKVLDMNPAIEKLRESLEQLRTLARDAALAMVEEPDHYAAEQLKAALDLLQQPGILASAPRGIALTSGKHLQTAASRNLIANAGENMDVSVVKRFTAAAGQNASVFVRKLGMKLFANQGPAIFQAQNDTMELLARQGLDIVSSEDEIHITAKKKITLNAGGSYITLDPYRIELGTKGDFTIKSAHADLLAPARMLATHPQYPKLESTQRLRIHIPQAPNAPQAAWAGMPYKLYADGELLQQGVLDDSGYLTVEHQVVTQQYRLETSSGVTYQIPVPSEYREPERGALANRGLQNHPSQTDSRVKQPVKHTDDRGLYSRVLNHLTGRKGDRE